MSVNNFHYKFDNITLFPNERLLVRDNETLLLSSRAFDVLLLMAQNPGKLILKQELMDKVWEDSFVEEGNLAVAINTLRKALKTEDQKIYIETFPKRGYRFNAQVEKVLVKENDDHDADVEKKLKQPDSLSISSRPLPTEVHTVVRSEPFQRNALPISSSKLIQGKWLLLMIIAIFSMIIFNIDKIAGKNTIQAQEQTASNDYKTKIAVLPFADLKPTAESENFGVDLADLIRNDISRDEDFTAVSSILPEKNSQDTARPETLKNEDGADFILAGTFSVEDEKAEIEYQLIKVKTGKIVLTNKEDLTGENRQQFVKKTVSKIKIYSDALSALLKKAE